MRSRSGREGSSWKATSLPSAGATCHPSTPCRRHGAETCDPERASGTRKPPQHPAAAGAPGSAAKEETPCRVRLGQLLGLDSKSTDKTARPRHKPARPTNQPKTTFGPLRIFGFHHPGLEVDEVDGGQAGGIAPTALHDHSIRPVTEPRCAVLCA
jgi:hypothetical protein